MHRSTRYIPSLPPLYTLYFLISFSSFPGYYLNLPPLYVPPRPCPWGAPYQAKATSVVEPRRGVVQHDDGQTVWIPGGTRRRMSQTRAATQPGKHLRLHSRNRNDVRSGNRESAPSSQQKTEKKKARLPYLWRWWLVSLCSNPSSSLLFGIVTICALEVSFVAKSWTFFLKHKQGI